MAHTIKVRRSGIERIFKKAPFSEWLDEQPRSALNYAPKKDIRDFNGVGWTTEDFARQSWERGLEVRLGSTHKWRCGSQPRPFIRHELEKAYPGIRF